MTTPDFPAWRPRLAACRRRAVTTVRQASLAELERFLAGIIPVHLLAQEDEGTNSRDRIFTVALTLQCFIWQMLKPRTACREVVRQVQALFGLLGRRTVKKGTGAYCLSRRRLPRERMVGVLAATAAHADRQAGRGGELRGRPVKVVDGSSCQLADTAANQAVYPQPKGQKRGCGFPVLKFLLLCSLNSGAALHAVLGNLHQHDLRLLRQLQEELRRGDILLGDRAYGEYATLARLPARGVDVVARVHAQRQVNFRRGRRLGRQDALFVWRKRRAHSSLWTPEEWAQVPDEITVRVLRFTAVLRGHRSQRLTLVTTLLDPVAYPAAEIIALYARRWRIELCLRDLKTTMGMEQLRCLTPAMVEKELLAYLIAYNLVRCLMAETVAAYTVDIQRLSFKGTLDAWRQFAPALARARSRSQRQRLWEELRRSLANDLVPLRPQRQEPRAVKRRPKPYPRLTRPRHQFKEVFHRNHHYRKTLKNKALI